jgi:hypothetical protein
MTGAGDAELPHDAHLDWEKGGAARLVSIAKEAVTLRSTIPSPPGSRIDGALRGSGQKVRFKIHGSKKQPEGDFVLEGRAIDLTREVREQLEALVASRPASPPRT